MCKCKKCKIRKQSKLSKVQTVSTPISTISSDALFDSRVKQAYIAGLPVPIFDYDPTSNVFQQYELNFGFVQPQGS